MGKKTKKNRFNKSVDVDVLYSSNTIAEVDPTDNMAELNITKEKAEEIQKIKAKLPIFSQASMVESELAKLPNEPPFRAFVHNVAYSANEEDVSQFFHPLLTTNINMVGGDGGSRGFCFVDFASKDDLAKALARNDSSLAGRSVNVRIAAPNSNDRTTGWTRDKTAGGARRSDATFERRRGSYRPAGLRDDDMAELNSGDSWRRGSVVANTSTFASGPQPPSSERSFNFRPLGTSASQSRPSLGTDEVSADRPKLNLQTRSTAAPAAFNSQGSRDSKIFGNAKPVDTASKDREILDRILAPAADATASKHQ